jgi:hypothetical protein
VGTRRTGPPLRVRERPLPHPRSPHRLDALRQIRLDSPNPRPRVAADAPAGGAGRPLQARRPRARNAARPRRRQVRHHPRGGAATANPAHWRRWDAAVASHASTDRTCPLPLGRRLGLRLGLPLFKAPSTPPVRLGHISGQGSEDVLRRSEPTPLSELRKCNGFSKIRNREAFRWSVRRHVAPGLTPGHESLAYAGGA